MTATVVPTSLFGGRFARTMVRIPVGRLGTPAEFGAACAFLCSAHAGYIVGQNLLIDGGALNATL